MNPFEMHEQATALAQAQNWSEALELETRAVALLRKRLDAADANLAIVLTNLATYHTEVGQWKEALPLYLEGLQIKEASAGVDDPSIASTLLRLARCYSALDQLDQSVAIYRRCVEILNADPDANPPLHLMVLEEFAVLLQEVGQRDESLPVLYAVIRLTASRAMKGERALFSNLKQACLACIAEGGAEGAAVALSGALGPERTWHLLGDLAHDLVERRRPQETSVPDTPDDPVWRAVHDAAMQALRRDPAQAKISAEQAVDSAWERFGPSSLALSLSLNVLAVSNQDLGDEEAALESFVASRQAVRDSLGPDHPVYSVSVYNVANCLAKLGRHAAAADALSEVLALKRALVPPDPVAVAIALQDMADLHEQGGQFEAASDLYTQAVDVLSPDDPLHTVLQVRRQSAQARSESGAAATGNDAEVGSPAVAEGEGVEVGLDSLHPEHLAILERLGASLATSTAHNLRDDANRLYAETREYLPEESPANVLVLCSLGKFRNGLGEVPEATSLFATAMEVARTHHAQPDDPTQGVVAEDLARLYSGQGRFAEAKPLFEQAVATRRAISGDTDRATLVNLDAQATNLLQLGEYRAAEAAYLEALEAMRAAYPDDQGATAIVGNLAVLYRHMGRYREASPLYEKAMDGAAALGTDSIEYIRALNNAALFFDELGQRARARDLYQRALAQVEANFGPRHADRGMLLNNLALIDSAEGRHDLALERFREACDIRREALGERHHDYMTSLHGVGLEQFQLGQSANAVETLERTLALKTEALGQDHVSCAITSSALAQAYHQAGRADDALSLFEQSLAVRKQALGELHPAVARSLGMQAQFHWLEGRTEHARPRFREALDIYRVLIRDLFPGMTEAERAYYWDNIREFFDVFTVFALECGETHPEILGDLYDVQLFAKALILDSVVRSRGGTANTEDAEAQRLEEDWFACKRRLASLMTARGGVLGDPQKVDQLRAEAKALEKALAQRSRRFNYGSQTKSATWQNVQERLAPDEAAIEIVRAVQASSSAASGAFYAALVLRSDTNNFPRLVPIGPASDLEGASLESYRESRQAISDIAYSTYWAPLEAELRGEHCVYLAPEGVYGQLEPNILHDGERFLLDACDVRLVTSTRDLLRTDSDGTTQRALLLGRPAYDTADTNSHHAEQRRFRDLPGSELEVREIETLLRARDWDVKVLLGDEARAAEVFATRNPGLLHIATHGFFLDPRERQFRTADGEVVSLVLEDDSDSMPGLSALVDALEQRHESIPTLVEWEAAGRSYLPNPLLRCGLALAGANHANSPDSPLDDDGLLTAYEATTLQLDGTELVVLSACDSMRGLIRAGEGVIGLERAFRTAGARYILAALWPVDDVIARELMQTLYQTWLESGNLRAAYRESQIQLRERYQLPMLWGGFVLIGA